MAGLRSQYDPVHPESDQDGPRLELAVSVILGFQFSKVLSQEQTHSHNSEKSPFSATPPQIRTSATTLDQWFSNTTFQEWQFSQMNAVGNPRTADRHK